MRPSDKILATGKYQLKREYRYLTFRKEEFGIWYHYLFEPATNHVFTTEDLDDLNMAQVHNAYRSKYGLPFVDEIRAIRKFYGLNAAKMAKVLGLTDNVYGSYEKGEIPSIALGRLIQLIKDPYEFSRLVHMAAGSFSKEDLEKITKKIDAASNSKPYHMEHICGHVFETTTPSVLTGYRMPDFNRMRLLVQYFSKHVKPFKTKLNKLLFYTDFLHYKEHACGISGFRYKAIQFGPVPCQYGSVYDRLMEDDDIIIEIVSGNNIEGEQFLCTHEPDLSIFSAEEQKTILLVVKKLGHYHTNKIVEKSHEEHAWTEHVDKQGLIKYDWGFFIRHL